MEASKQQLALAPKFDEAPSLPTLPKAGCLLTVYCREVLSRLEDVKAYITSTFGSVLKIDSTKKVKYYKQVKFMSIVIFCLYRKHRHIRNKTNQVPQIVHYTPPSPTAQLKNISFVTHAIVIITVSVIFFNFVVGY